MNCIIFHGSAASRDLIYDTEWFYPGTGKNPKVYKFNVLITTYEVVLYESARLKRVPWAYLIIDEGHRIKVSFTLNRVIILLEPKIEALSNSERVLF